MSTARSPATSTTVIQIGTLQLQLQTPPDFDALLDEAARRTPDNVDAIPYYATLWPSAHALAKTIWEMRDRLPGQRVLELGCGLGLPAIVAAKLGAAVIASDFHPDAGGWCLANAAANGVALQFHPCDWQTPPAWEPFDLVLGSDLIYERRHIPALVACVDQLCAPHGLALLADPGRDGLPQLTDALQTRGWQINLIPCDNIYVLHCRKGTSPIAVPQRAATGA
jgi:predicted nicotinamide N-methyase